MGDASERPSMTNDETWTAVDGYLSELLLPADSALDAALRASEAADLPAISVTPPQGKLLQMLAVLCGARMILEIGTLGGYSAIWMARALPPGGRLITLEFEEKHAAVALGNIARAGLAESVDLRVGRALDLLPVIAAEEHPPFDLTFVDADKVNTPEYFKWALQLSRPGSLIVVDNVIRKGAIVDAASDDVSVQGMRRFFDVLAAEPRVSATALQTVGAKGYDGFAIALVAGKTPQIASR
jgi:predicted O-methyltransferase YrrM